LNGSILVNHGEEIMDHVDEAHQDDKEHPLVGQSLGRYKILSLMGKGGMGAVFKGRDETLKRDVAIKVMSAQLASDELPGAVLQEGHLRVSHPNVVDL
jgi:serine/threonine-protein kinase